MRPCPRRKSSASSTRCPARWSGKHSTSSCMSMSSINGREREPSSRASGKEQNFVGSVVGFSGELMDKHRRITRRVLVQRIATPQCPRSEAVAIASRRGDWSPRWLKCRGCRWWMASRALLVAPQHSGPDRARIGKHAFADPLVLRRPAKSSMASFFAEPTAGSRRSCPPRKRPNCSASLPRHRCWRSRSCALSERGDAIEYYYALFRTDLASLHIRIESEHLGSAQRLRLCEPNDSAMPAPLGAKIGCPSFAMNKWRAT